VLLKEVDALARLGIEFFYTLAQQLPPSPRSVPKW
jgi:hypothetical protein